MNFQVKGNIVDLHNKRIFKGVVFVKDGIIENIIEEDHLEEQYILPGFIDAHVHIESSMLIPSQFARLATLHGTVATVSDPHEIANVVGIEGIRFMIENGKSVPFRFCFGAPSCVPATTFETAGAEITPKEIEALFVEGEVKYLAEMMNWPGVLYEDTQVFEKLAIAKRYGKPIDGHAPGLKGHEATKYASAGINTDHECFTKEEALDKLKAGMKILIREGSAAKNFEALIELLHDHEDSIMFCSDDKHPDSLLEGHINILVKRAVEKGIDIFKVLKAACLNPALHYNIGAGLLRKGDPADFVVLKDLIKFNVIQTYVGGVLTAQNGQPLIQTPPSKKINNFIANPITPLDLRIASSSEKVRVIEALDGQLITNCIEGKAILNGDFLESDVENDILKIAVVNRYRKTAPAVAFIKNIGIKSGAIASSVAHDSHNIIVVGTDDTAMCKAVNGIIDVQGGIAAVYEDDLHLLPLPVAGLMSDQDGFQVAKDYTLLDSIAKKMGSKLKSPFMTLSFMALLVIPDLKLSDKGLFSGKEFKFIRVTV